MIPQKWKILIDPAHYVVNRALAYIAVFRHKRFKKKELITQFEVVHRGDGTFLKRKKIIYRRPWGVNPLCKKPLFPPQLEDLGGLWSLERKGLNPRITLKDIKAIHDWINIVIKVGNDRFARRFAEQEAKRGEEVLFT